VGCTHGAGKRLKDKGSLKEQGSRIKAKGQKKRTIIFNLVP
jgi:hypothetical protein